MENFYSPLEHIETIKDSQDFSGRMYEEYTPVQLDYITELIPDPAKWEATPSLMRNYIINNLDLRIAEISGSDMVKCIDHNKQLKELLAPIRDTIDTKYLEAPYDHEQISLISDLLSETEGVRFEEWKELSFEERVELIQELEEKIAVIEHRPACTVEIRNLPKGTNGSCLDGTITLNEKLLVSSAGNKDSFYKLYDTLLHEGRHAYQDYNIYEREVHTRRSEINSWNDNIVRGYESGNNTKIGMRLYAYQPLEIDARQFAADVVEELKRKGV